MKQIILSVIILSSSCNSESENILLELQKQGLVNEIPNDQFIKCYNEITTKELGYFNHISEILDIGFTPNNVYMNFNFPREYYLMIFLSRIINLSKGSLNIKFNTPTKSDNYYIDAIINGNDFKVEVSKGLGVYDGGLSMIIDLLNKINFHLEEQRYAQRFVIIKTREIHTNSLWGKTYESILNYRVSLIPFKSIKYLLLQEAIILPDDLLINPSIRVTENYHSKDYNWGYSISKIHEITNGEIITTNNIKWEIENSFCRQFENILSQSTYKYDNLEIRIFELNSDRIIQESNNLHEIKDCDFKQQMEFTLRLGNKSVKLKDQKVKLLQEASSIITNYLNEFALKTNQKHLIGISYNDFETYESQKSLLQIHPHNEGDLLEQPHLKMLTEKDYQSDFNCYFKIDLDDTRLVKLGYVKLEESELYYNLFNK